MIILKRQNKDGRTIFDDKVWEQMKEIGHNLERIRYRESKKSPNLFYKNISDNRENGVIFVDIRGTDVIPIWDDPRPITYYRDISFSRYIKELILLKREECKPRLTFYQRSEPDGWAFLLKGIPGGLCKECGKDIINEVDWGVLEGGLYDKNGKDKKINIHKEIFYCIDCKRNHPQLIEELKP